MKISATFAFAGLWGFGGLLSSCNSSAEYPGRQGPGFVSPYRVATVEKSWMARHKYDHERRLLIPVHNGTRWGAVQEYKEDGSIAFRDWWVRGEKREDLEANPSTDIVTAERSDPAFQSDQETLGPSSSPTALPSTLPAFGNESVPAPDATAAGLPEISGAEPFFPELPPSPAETPEIAPFELTPSDVGTPAGEVAAPTPFAPLPGALPSAPLPGTAMPVTPLPGAVPMAPNPGAAGLPGLGVPAGPQPPEFPGAPPMAPEPGGGFIDPNPLAPAPAVPGVPLAPPVPGGGGAPVPANPFPPVPAIPVPGPGGLAPVVDPAPAQLPGPAPIAPGGPAPIEANPFGPAPGGPEPVPGNGGAVPVAPLPVPDGPPSIEANPFGPAPGVPAPGGGGVNPLAPVPGGPPAPLEANPFAPAPGAGGGNVPQPADPFGPAPNP